MTGIEILKRLTEGKTGEDTRNILSRKVLMAAALILAIDDLYQRVLADKGTCENQLEVDLCLLAGQAKAWLMDIPEGGDDA